MGDGKLPLWCYQQKLVYLYPPSLLPVHWRWRSCHVCCILLLLFQLLLKKTLSNNFFLAVCMIVVSEALTYRLQNWFTQAGPSIVRKPESYWNSELIASPQLPRPLSLLTHKNLCVFNVCMQALLQKPYLLVFSNLLHNTIWPSCGFKALYCILQSPQVASILKSINHKYINVLKTCLFDGVETFELLASSVFYAM